MSASLSSPNFLAFPDARHLRGSLSTDDFHVPHVSSAAVLGRASKRLGVSGAKFAGSVTPKEAWDLIEAHCAVLVDVRTAEERQFVGRVTNSIHVPWLIGPSLQRNKGFVREVEAKARRDDVLLVLCRNGRDSARAAQALTEARFHFAFNVLEGFDGDLDESQQRGSLNGWRFHQLPWIQD